MLTQAQTRALIESAIKYGVRQTVDGIEVTVTASDVSTSRFANNGMTQNQSPERTVISVRVQKNGRQARLTGDQTSVAGIRKLVDNAITAASFLEKDPDLLPLPAKQSQAKIKNVNRFNARTASFSADDRAAAIASVVKVAKKQGLVSAGIFATGTTNTAIGNSNGLFRFHQETSAELSVTMRKIDETTGSESTGWAKQNSPRVTDINAVAIAEQAAAKAVASANPIEIPPGKYTVILEPPAVLDLIDYLAHDFSGTSHVDKLSCFLGKEQERVVGENITITDDVFHQLQAGAPFDGEGLQREKVELIKNGVLTNLVYGRRSAAQLKATVTGHGMPEPSIEGEMPLNLVITGGNTSLEEMIRSTERGVLLTRVWYVREVDPTTKIVTGMTRDGTFLIENGAIKCGIKNFRFNQSLIEMLQHADALSPAQRTAGEGAIPAVVPAMRVKDFNFASVTRF